jgi:hypothetical protein
MNDTQILHLAEQEIARQNKRINNLTDDLKIAMKALRKIANQDYRGNQHSEVFIAKLALDSMQEK